MATTRSPAPAEPVQELSEQEWEELVDRAACHYLGISGEEFIRRWKASEFAEPDRPEVMNVAMLLPVER